MATPPRVSENPATQRNYVAQLTIAASLSLAIRQLWESLNPLSSREALEAFGAAAHAVVGQFSATAVMVAADSYRTAREAAGITVPARLPDLPAPPTAKVDKELAWMEQVRLAAVDLDGEITDLERKLQAEADEAYQKAVADEARQYTVDAVAGDERALGFRRVSRPGACAWCLTLAIRKSTRRGLAKDLKGKRPGAMGGDEHWGVYKSRESAGQLPPNATGEVNRYHFNCHCSVEPIFDASFVPPGWLQDASDLYDSTDGGLNGFRRALNARRRGEVSPDQTPVLPITSPSAAQRAQSVAIADLLSRISA